MPRHIAPSLPPLAHSLWSPTRRRETERERGRGEEREADALRHRVNTHNQARTTCVAHEGGSFYIAITVPVGVRRCVHLTRTRAGEDSEERDQGSPSALDMQPRRPRAAPPKGAGAAEGEGGGQGERASSNDDAKPLLGMEELLAWAAGAVKLRVDRVQQLVRQAPLSKPSSTTAAKLRSAESSSTDGTRSL